MQERSHAAAARPRRGSVLALILAGGSGSRLMGLTDGQSKPAVPFGGHYRTVDFTLSNCVNSGIREIALLTQYKSQSLIRHIQSGWGFLRRELGELVEVWPAQQRLGEHWYSGTADAVWQNRDLIDGLEPELVLILAGDHIYSMDYSLMLEAHAAREADVTVACVEVPVAEAQSYGIVGIDREGRIRSFIEKPERTVPTSGRRDTALASMGIYVFNRTALFDRLERDAADDRSSHDFGYNVLPAAVDEAGVFAYVFRDAASGGPGYWRDVGTVDGYWGAHMDLLEERPPIDLADKGWPLLTAQTPAAPTRISNAVRVSASIVGHGSVVAGDIDHSVISTECSVEARSVIKDSVLLPNVHIGKNCFLERVVVDSGCVIPDDTEICGDLGNSAGPYRHYVSPHGIVLLTRQRHGPIAAPSATQRKVA